MPCGSCGQRRQNRENRVRETAAARGRPTYTVTAPDGSKETFERYIDAVTYKRRVKGTLSTSS